MHKVVMVDAAFTTPPTPAPPSDPSRASASDVAMTVAEECSTVYDNAREKAEVRACVSLPPNLPPERLVWGLSEVGGAAFHLRHLEGLVTSCLCLPPPPTSRPARSLRARLTHGVCPLVYTVYENARECPLVLTSCDNAREKAEVPDS